MRTSLNNPAAAVQRATGQLRQAVAAYGETSASAGDLPPEARAAIAALLARGPLPGASLDPLARSDREEAIGEWLTARGIEDGWEIAPVLVGLGLDRGELERQLAALAPAELPAVLQAVQASSEVQGLLLEVTEGTTRLSAIVKALKSYSYLDRAPVQPVDVRVGLDDTLLILKSKLAGITIAREYAADLPAIEAQGGELNQVWTNLIDNAADAVRSAGRADGRIALRTLVEGESLVVEVEDNGSGVAPEHRDRVFDSFFTTKPPGSGTGLGLDISFRIVVNAHGGSLQLAHSEPGRTLFRVALPLQRPQP